MIYIGDKFKWGDERWIIVDIKEKTIDALPERDYNRGDYRKMIRMPIRSFRQILRLKKNPMEETTLAKELTMPKLKQYSQMLSQYLDRAIGGDVSAQQMLREVYGGTWTNLKRKLMTEDPVKWDKIFQRGVEGLMYVANPKRISENIKRKIAHIPHLYYQQKWSNGAVVRIDEPYKDRVIGSLKRLNFKVVDIGIGFDYNARQYTFYIEDKGLATPYMATVWGKKSNPGYNGNPKRGQIIAIYDNGGKTFDRFTVVLSKKYAVISPKKYYMMLGLSLNPDSPQGFSQWGEGLLGPHLGKKIAFSSLPKNVQQHIIKRLK